MKKQTLTERFQQLAGLKPLYEEFKSDGTKNVYQIILGLQRDCGALLRIAESLFKNHNEGKDPSEYDKLIGRDVERDPAWPTLKNQLQGKELFMYFLFKAAGFQNIQDALPFGEAGNVESVINYYIELIAAEDFDADDLSSNFDPQINVRNLGSGDIKEDRDILLRLITTENGLNYPDIPISQEEMYKELNKGTLDSSGYKVSTSVS